VGSADTPLLEARALATERGGRVLFEDLHLSLGSGEIVHLRGANGAGKTTLMRILAGLSQHGHEGSVSRQGACLYLGHHSAVKGALTTRENLTWHPSGEHYGSAVEIDAALAQVGLMGYEDVAAARLSAGQQRRVNLARLFLSSRPLWLLDEPFTAIDADGVAALTRRIAAHAAAGGAVLLTSHQPVETASPVREIRLGAAGQA
jgi:heme exporter protein A